LPQLKIFSPSQAKMEHSTRPGTSDSAMQDNHPELYGKGAELNSDLCASEDHDHGTASSATGEKQAGVERMEAVSKSWTKASLIIAYVTSGFPSH
jgi:hypothetical protein